MFEKDVNEGQIFGLQVEHDFKLIGNVYIFCDSLANLLETINDETTIINTKGENKGKLHYSIIPCMYDDKGEEMYLLGYEGVH